MSYEIKNNIERYIAEFTLLQSLIKDTKSRDSSDNQIGNDLISHGVGMLARDIFGTSSSGKYGKNIAKNYLKNQQKQQQEIALRNHEARFNSLLNEMDKFFITISIQKRGLTASGNSHLLLSRLAKIHGIVNLESRIRKTIGVLHICRNEQLVYNKDIKNDKIPSIKPAEKKSYEILKNLETKLRILIEKKLSKISSNWWVERIPNDVRVSAEQKRKRNEKPWPWYNHNDEPLISYLDFNDYIKIIRKGNNWRDAFKHIFVDEEMISSKLRELDPIRNRIAHSKELTQEDNIRLELHSTDIIRAIEK